MKKGPGSTRVVGQAQGEQISVVLVVEVPTTGRYEANGTRIVQDCSDVLPLKKKTLGMAAKGQVEMD
jgi:hypothetical protein